MTRWILAALTALAFVGAVAQDEAAPDTTEPAEEPAPAPTMTVRYEQSIPAPDTLTITSGISCSFVTPKELRCAARPAQEGGQ